MIDEKEAFDIIYLDFKKAFDSVPHERLLIKLAAYGLSGNILKWIRSFLSGRTQRVRVGSEKSGEAKVKSGIPQGSILGPVLFTVFINDLPDSLHSICKIFADDTKIYDKSSNHLDIQDDLDRLLIWSDTWDMQFNASKFKVLHFGKNNPGLNYVLRSKKWRYGYRQLL